ncbi:MAG: zf-HC2 domain-containing protein [Proteobacteria bacterium]|nr:zf-HC2 domain-containing protein [Pseudomonadota bacterium]
MSEPMKAPGDGALMIHCRHAAVLLSKREDAPLARADALKLKLHLALCRHCRNAARQFAAIGLALRRWRDGDG